MDYKLNIPKGTEEELGRLFRQAFSPRKFIQRALNQFFKGRFGLF